MGPELRQYLFLNNNEGKPFSRNQYEQTVKSGKYLNRMMGFGSERDFSEPGYYIRNAVFPKQRDEMKADNTTKVKTKVYKMDADNLFSRREHREEKKRIRFICGMKMRLL